MGGGDSGVAAERLARPLSRSRLLRFGVAVAGSRQLVDVDAGDVSGRPGIFHSGDGLAAVRIRACGRIEATGAIGESRQLRSRLLE